MYYANVDELGGVPYFTSEEIVKDWTKGASTLVGSHLCKITFSYDVVDVEGSEFNPELLQLYSVKFSNSDVSSLPSGGGRIEQAGHRCRFFCIASGVRCVKKPFLARWFGNSVRFDPNPAFSNAHDEHSKC